MFITLVFVYLSKTLEYILELVIPL